MKVSVAYAGKKKKVWLKLDVEAPATVQQVIDLSTGWPNLYLRVHQPGRPHHLFDNFTAMLALIRTRSSRDKDGLRHQPLELLKLQWSVVQC